ncbi:MAG TPA: SpoIVB peptidase S55 domain-containing protein [Microlunatus sp.]
MTSTPRTGRIRTALVGIGVGLAVVSGTLAAPARAAAAPESACPAPVPIASVTAGMTGEGYTVVRGTEPRPFSVQVLGVLKDGIGAGRDMIMIEVSDLPGERVIEAGGGIWAGMSGSPVYVDGQLLGSVSYGFTLSPSPIGGVTPAADMLKLLNLSARQAARPEGAEEPAKVPVPAAARRTFDSRARAAVPRTLSKLPAPFSISGLNSTRLRQFQADADAADLPVIAYAGSSKAAPSSVGPSVAAAAPVPGGNFAAAMSYGDLTAAAVGTTTAVCDDQALAFGHPFNLSGPATYGANNADSLSIVKDDTVGSFKLANITDAVGMVDQDRLAGLRARLGISPKISDVRSTIRNADTGRVRRGSTKVTTPNMLAELTAFGLLAGYDTTFDEIGDGRATSHWTIIGTRAGGRPLIVHRDNRWASREDVASDPAFDVAYAVDALLNNEFEPVTIDQVRYDSTVGTEYRQLRITGLAVSVNGGRYVAPRALTVTPGATLRVRVTIQPFRSSVKRVATATLTVPRNARGRIGALTAIGGVDLNSGLGEEEPGCLLEDPGCADEPVSSLNQIARGITSQPQNDDLVIRLALESEIDGSVQTTSKSVRRKDTVAGQRSIAITVS